MKLRTSLPCVVIGMLLLTGLPLCAQSVVGQGCDLAVFGFKETNSFLNFDRDLRDTLGKRDFGRLAALVQFPLRVTDDRGMMFIHDSRSLQLRFEEIFTPDIRKAILSSTPDTIWCNYTGISYGNGLVWVNVTDKGYFVMTVNLPANHPSRTSTDYAVEMACHTDQRRVVIDSLPDGKPRFRSWSYGSSVSKSPDMEISAGDDSFEGTGPCAHHVWTFHASKITVQVEEPGCYGDSDAPPINAQAILSISNAPDPSKTSMKKDSAWCF